MKIALIGNVANVAYQTCKFLRRKGVQADVFVNDVELQHVGTNPVSHDPDIFEQKPEWLIIKQMPKPGQGIWGQPGFRIIHKLPQHALYRYNLFKELRTYDLLESFNCAPFWIRYIGKPYISFATGSDLRELTKRDTKQGRKAREIFKHAEIVFFGPDPGHIERVRTLQLKNSYPYRQIIDTEFYRPNTALRQSERRDELVIFHPSRQDWTYQGAERDLAGLKGNDKLIRGFARFVKDGHKAKLILLDRGPDSENTKQLLSELQIWQQVELLAEMNRHDLVHYYNHADVVADQFTTGGMGLIGLEAMACGRPLFVYLDEYTTNLCYEEFPPVLNCSKENEIYEQLKQALAIDSREEIGARARKWIMRYHHWEKVIDRLIWHYETVLGRKVV